MKLHLTALAIWLVAHVSIAQNGNFFLSHYSPQQENIDHFSFDIAQDKKGVVLFANKAGVLQFDGRNWVLTSSPGPIYTLAITDDNQVYAGGLAGFGRLQIVNNEEEYTSLSANDPKAINIFQSLAIKNQVYFLSHENLFVLDAANGTLTQTIPAAPNSFTGLFEIQGRVFIQTEDGQLMQLQGKGLIKAQLNESAGEILFAHNQHGLPGTLIGTSNDRIFLYNQDKLSEVVLKDAEYLQSNVLVSGVRLDANTIALGTLRGGVIFVNAETGETVEIINYYTGLPDNEVYAMLSDRNNGVWVAHDYGFTRIAPFLPFRSFSHYPGLEGNLLCAYSSDNTIYVGTTLGLFKLVKDAIYTEEVYFVSKQKSGAASQAPAVEEQQTSDKTRRGLFGRRKAKKEEAKTTAATTTKTTATASVTVKEKRTRKILKSLQYRYARVGGIAGKTTHLLKIDGGLYAAGVGGVFRINDQQAVSITNEPVRSVFLSPSLNQLIISTYNEEVKSFKNLGNSWQETHLLDTLQEYVSYMFEDKLQNLWLCGRASTLKVEMIDGKITNIDRVPYLRPSIDETVGLAVGSDVYVVNAGEFQRYDVANSKFVKYDSLPGTRKYFASAGSFWFHDGHRWRTIDKRLGQSMQLEWLGLFSDIRYLTPADDAKSLWVISASNELYRFSPDKEAKHVDYPLFLRDVKGPETKLVKSKLQVEEEDGMLTFEFIQPDYFGNQSMEYRYMVAGLSDVWSSWSPTNNVIPFPYIPSGEYEIRVQSKNLFGKVNEVEKIYFSVLPPYWKRPWFYAMEVSVLSLLVLLSVRLSVSNSKYQMVSRVLSLLTVIIFIQLAETSIYSLISIQSSPVIEFLIQVVIAMLVLPLESRLRKFMQDAAEGKYSILSLRPKEVPK